MRLPKFRCKNKVGNWCFFTVLHNGNVNEENFNLETLSEFTGLLDKQGVEIYEGDILSHSLQGNRFVEYGSPFKNYGGYMLVSKNGMRGTLNDSDKLYEVIGNIYENPELLGDENGRKRDN